MPVSRKKAAKGTRKPGYPGDPRMNHAVQAKINNPNLFLVAPLMTGGFIFSNLADEPGSISALSGIRTT